MTNQRRCAILALLLLSAMIPTPPFAHPRHMGDHHGDERNVETHSITAPVILASATGDGGSSTAAPLISGQGDLRFKVRYTSDLLPQEALDVLGKAHGGFAVDRRSGRGEVYFALPGAGIIQLSADLGASRMIDTPPEVKDASLHNNTLWSAPDGTTYLTFSSVSSNQLFTTTLDGKLIHTFDAPGADFDFGHATVNEYFRSGGKFVPTDVEYLNGTFFITTGYSPLDYVLTAKVTTAPAFAVRWHDFVFGGRGTEPGLFSTGHGITLTPERDRFSVSDRPTAEVERFTLEGEYVDSIRLPEGSWPCEIDYAHGYAVIGCLHGPDRPRGAPIYIIEGDRVVSTIMAKAELGLENFQHIHDAAIVKVGDKLYIIAQAWNPGDFVILEQVGD